jgi:hypothetical protein
MDDVCGEVFCDRDNWSGKASGPDFEYRYRCARCGDFILPDALKYGPLNGLTSRQRAILSQRLRRMQRDKAPPPQITNNILPKVSDRLPALLDVSTSETDLAD